MRISRFGQIKIYFGKCFRLFLSEKQWKNFLSTLLIMLIISLVTDADMFRTYAETKNGAFAVICACIWVGLFNSIQSICRERAIIKREHRTGLHISSYILAHVLYEAAMCAVEALLITVIVCLTNLGHLPPSGLLFGVIVDFFLTFFLVTFSADMIAVLISSVVKKENTAMTVMPFVLIIQLVMSGSVFDLEGATKVISNITISKWGLNAICAIANTHDQVYSSSRYLLVEGCDPTIGNLLLIWLILLFFSALYILLSIVILKRVDKDHR